MYIHREIEKLIKRYLKVFPITALMGPRQSGKSTTLLNLYKKKYRYVTFDDFRNVELFNTDRLRFVRQNNNYVIFDEAQKVPEIFNLLKIEVDNDRDRNGKFILTGSGNFLMMKNISESLAGRIGLLNLLTFEYNEIPPRHRYNSIYLGAYPGLVTTGYKNWSQWYSSYIDTYLTRDLRNFSEIGDIRDFTRFIRLLASRVSTILNLSELSRAIGVTVKTIKRWISILEASYIVFLLEPYYKNLGKRIIKSPKLYFYDTGLVSYFCGIANAAQFENGPMAGAIFENYIVSELVKRESNNRKGNRFYYYRTSNGEEIDIIIEKGMSLEIAEIKNTETLSPRFIRTLKNFPAEVRKSFLIYRGKNLGYGRDMEMVNFNYFLRR